MSDICRGTHLVGALAVLRGHRLYTFGGGSYNQHPRQQHVPTGSGAAAWPHSKTRVHGEEEEDDEYQGLILGRGWGWGWLGLGLGMGRGIKLDNSSNVLAASGLSVSHATHLAGIPGFVLLSLFLPPPPPPRMSSVPGTPSSRALTSPGSLRLTPAPAPPPSPRPLSPPLLPPRRARARSERAFCSAALSLAPWWRSCSSDRVAPLESAPVPRFPDAVAAS